MFFDEDMLTTLGLDPSLASKGYLVTIRFGHCVVGLLRAGRAELLPLQALAVPRQWVQIWPAIGTSQWPPSERLATGRLIPIAVGIRPPQSQVSMPMRLAIKVVHKPKAPSGSHARQRRFAFRGPIYYPLTWQDAELSANLGNVSDMIKSSESFSGFLVAAPARLSCRHPSVSLRASRPGPATRVRITRHGNVDCRLPLASAWSRLRASAQVVWPSGTGRWIKRRARWAVEPSESVCFFRVTWGLSAL